MGAARSPAMPTSWRSWEVGAIRNYGESWRRSLSTNARSVTCRGWTSLLPNFCSTALRLLPSGYLWLWLKSVTCVTYTGLSSKGCSSTVWFSKFLSRRTFLNCISDYWVSTCGLTYMQVNGSLAYLPQSSLVNTWAIFLINSSSINGSFSINWCLLCLSVTKLKLEMKKTCTISCAKLNLCRLSRSNNRQKS